eukprot:sb/3470976/
MPWPFNDDDDGDGRRGGFFGNRGDPFKEFEDLFRMFDVMQPTGPSRSQPPADQPAAKLQNPRAYFLHDPRHIKERNKSGGGGGSGGVRDEEVDIRGDLGVLTRPPQVPQYGGGGGVTRESTSYSQRWVNGMQTQRRLELEGRSAEAWLVRLADKRNNKIKKKSGKAPKRRNEILPPSMQPNPFPSLYPPLDWG